MTIEHNPNLNRKAVAAFDFDGTVSYGDTSIYFLLFTAGFFKTGFLLLANTFVLLGFVLRMIPRQKAKERIFQAFFQGKTIEEMKKLGQQFATKKLPKHIKPKALDRIRWHLEKGHCCILISASLELYLEPWAKSVGFSHVIASKLAVDSRGNVSGKLEGLNCRDKEKVRRLKEVIGPLENYEIYAYGDSDGDKELLKVADHPFYRQMP